MRSGIQILDVFFIPSREIELISSLSGGKGGQHVNKTYTKITMRWNVVQSQVINELQRALLMSNLKLSKDGCLVIQSDEHRSQNRNIEMTYAKCKKIVESALHIPKKRKATRPSFASKQKKRQKKQQRSELKRSRKRPDF